MSNVNTFNAQLYVPSTEATGNLLIGYSRNSNAFSINQYATVRRVEKDTGLYWVLDPDEAGRVLNPQDYDWPDGNEAPEPKGQNNNEFTTAEYKTQRKAYPFMLGGKAVQQAQWPVLAAAAATQASKAMIDRTQTALTALSSNSSITTDTATSLGGGLWSAATTSNLYIKKTLFGAVTIINQQTNSVVGFKDLILVLSPALATVMAETDEVHNYMKGTQFAMDVIKGQNFVGTWGLPDYLYGIKVQIEDCVQVTSVKGQTRAAGYVLADNVAYLISRKEGLEGNTFGPSFSTLNIFFFNDEMTVESYYDNNDRLHRGRVVQDFAAVVTAPAAAYKITGCQ